MLGNFEDQPVLDSFDLKSIEDGGNVSLKLHIYDCADDLAIRVRTWEICPFLRVAVAFAVEKAWMVLLRRLRTNMI